MHLDLTDDEAAVLLRELDGLIDGDRSFMSQRIKTLRAIQDQAGARARAVASAAEAICATAGDSKAETAGGTLSCPDERRHPVERRDFAGSLGGLLLSEFAEISGII